MDATRRQVHTKARADGLQRFTQQHGPGNDRIAGEMSLCGRMIGREKPLKFSQRYPVPVSSPAMSPASAPRASLPVSLRGSDSTKHRGRGRKTASMR